MYKIYQSLKQFHDKSSHFKAKANEYLYFLITNPEIFQNIITTIYFLIPSKNIQKKKNTYKI